MHCSDRKTVSKLAQSWDRVNFCVLYDKFTATGALHNTKRKRKFAQKRCVILRLAQPVRML
jgi:hypothetical protein